MQIGAAFCKVCMLHALHVTCKSCADSCSGRLLLRQSSVFYMNAWLYFDIYFDFVLVWDQLRSEKPEIFRLQNLRH
jgi:hypothetical protein